MYDKEVHKNHEKTALLLKKFITFVPIKHIYSVNITFYNHNANKAAISLRRDPHTSVWGGVSLHYTQNGLCPGQQLYNITSQHFFYYIPGQDAAKTAS